MSAFAKRFWIAGCLTVVPAVALACSVPVFRYALDHWRPDAYQVFVYHEQDLGEQDESLVQRLVKRPTPEQMFKSGRSIAEIWPGTQVIERYSQSLARAESRTKAKQVAEESLAAERQAGEAVLLRESASCARRERQHRRAAQLVIPLILLLAATATVLASSGFLIALATTPILAVALATLSNWLAAALAAKQDAAVVLQGE